MAHIASINQRKSMPCKSKVRRGYTQYVPEKPAYTVVSLCGRGGILMDKIALANESVDWCEFCQIGWDELEARGEPLTHVYTQDDTVWSSSPYNFATTLPARKRRRVAQMPIRDQTLTAERDKKRRKERERDRRAARLAARGEEATWE